MHTKSWDRWTYWRDLAGMEPERVSVRSAKQEAQRRERGWDLDGRTMTVYSVNGVDFEPPLVFTGLKNTHPNHDPVDWDTIDDTYGLETGKAVWKLVVLTAKELND